jgi:hypothetical protein
MALICDRVEAQLSRYRDGEMDRLSEWRIRRHLQGCPRCLAAADDASELDFAMRLALVEAEPPAYLAAAVMRRLPAMPPARRSGWRPARGRAVRWLVGIGCAVAQIAGLWGAYRYGATRADQRRPVARPALLGSLAADRLWVARPAARPEEPAGARRGTPVPLAPQPAR